MKNKILLWIVTTALCYLSCEKEESDLTLSNDYIRFSVAKLTVEPGTRSTFHNTFPTNGTFGVMGYCVPFMREYDKWDWASGIIGWGNKKVNAHPDVFYKQEVTYSGGGCTYKPLQRWYTPTDYLYSFFAYYPKENFTVLSAQDDFGAPSVKFSIPFDGTTANDTTKVLDYDKVPDAMAAQEIDITKGSGIVTLNFMHLMSGLNFQVNNYNAAEDENGNLAAGKPVTIHSLKLRGKFYKSVDIYFDNRYDYPDEVFYGTYELLGDSDDDDVTVEALTSYERIGDKTLLLVSNLNKTGIEDGYLGDLKLVIEYTFGEPGNTGRKIQYISRPDNFQPSGGTIYTAQLNFIGDAFVLNFIVDNDSRWEDGGDSEITFG